MIPIDETTRARFLSEALQGVRMDVHPVSGEDFSITEANIMQGTFVLDRRSVFGDSIGIGTVCADELSFVLYDPDGAFRAAGLEGAELYVRLAVPESDGADSLQRFLPIGYFTVDDVTRGQDNLTVTALDRMVQFDQDFVLPDDPASVGTVPKMLEYLCTLCRVPLAETDYTDVPNIGYHLSLPDAGTVYTCREMLSWACEIAGACARMDWEGKLRLEWFADTDVILTPSNRFSSDLSANPITITGVKATVGETDILAGSDQYALSVEGNPLLGEDGEGAQTAISGIGARVIGFSYTPFEASVLPMPFVLPLDVLSFEDAEGISHRVAVTEVSFCLNRSTVLRGVGQSTTKKSYARADPLTDRERVVLEGLKRQFNRRVGQSEQAAIEFDKVISGALGLYTTDVTQEDGSVIRYLHDKPTLEESTVIFVQNAGGIASTDSGWNNGHPVWKAGQTAAGDALFRFLAAERIEANWLHVGNQTVTEYIEGGLSDAKDYADSAAGAAQAAASKELSDYAKEVDERLVQFEVDSEGIKGRIESTETRVEEVLSDAKDYADQVSGKGPVESIDYYLVSSKNTGITTDPDEGWTQTPPLTSPDQPYLWHYKVEKYQSGQTVTSAPAVIGTHGATGASGQAGTAGKDGKDGADAILLMIDSSGGNIFKNSAIATILSVSIIVGDNILSGARQTKAYFGDSARLIWQEKRMGEDEFSPLDGGDPRLSDEGFLLTLNPQDVETKTVFRCLLDIT